MPDSDTDGRRVRTDRGADAAARWDARERAGVFNPALFVGDAAVVTWLVLARLSFMPHPATPWWRVIIPGLLAALLAWALRWHRFSGERRLSLVRRAAGFALGLGAGLAVLSATGVLRTTVAADLWLAGTSGVLLLFLRIVYFATRAAWPASRLEMLRWLALAAAVTVVFRPFFTADGVGAGDAYWYTLMLTDFVTQWRAGVFPVWVGQSVYAFNGSVSPLRLAPWFQHAGGILDLLTFHALAPIALKNATLMVNALVGGFTTYFCLRAILPNRPTIAAILAWLWLASPGVLAPVMGGDQYMTFMTLPFVPVVLYGCWCAWNDRGRRALFCLPAGLAGLWLCHAPIALWLCLFSALQYLALLIVRRSWRTEWLRLAGMAVLFVVLGSFPFVSVASLANLINVPTQPGSVVAEVKTAFPANLLPIDTHRDIITAYQLGFTVMGAGLLTLLLALRFRPRGAMVFLAAAILIGPFTLPVPWLTSALWHSLPSWFVTIENVWPMERLFLIWSLVIFFALAIVLADGRLARRRWFAGLLAASLVGGGGWSWHEACKLRAWVMRTHEPAAAAERMLAPNNVTLTRYCYSIFKWTPAYVNHGYMDPYLQNRLLDPETGKVLLANANAAAPLLARRDRHLVRPYPRLVQTGTFTATRIGVTSTFRLTPALTLKPGQRYALRFDFFRPDENGVLQINGDSLYREYFLPDAGVGLGRRGPSLTFGSEPRSDKVLSLWLEGRQTVTPDILFVASHAGRSMSLPFARFWLFTFAPEKLPIEVQSLIPYRARVRTAVPAWLETPRVWQPQWHATVNGRPVAVRESAQSLVAVPVPEGTSEVTLRYRPSRLLMLSYLTSLVGWGALLAAGGGVTWRIAGRFGRAP